jgi:carboxyl-terminal processing protease
MVCSRTTGLGVIMSLVMSLAVALPLDSAATVSAPTTVPATVSATIPATISTATPAIAPTEYVKIALDFIEQQALRRSKVDWPKIRATAEQKASSAADLPATYPIIREALTGLADRHSSFQPPPDAARLTQGKVNSYGFVATWPDRIVVSLSTGGPAQQAGLKLRDRIDQVQGTKPAGVNGVVGVKKVQGEFPKLLTLIVTRPPAIASTGKPPTRSARLRIRIPFGETSLVQAPKADPVVSQSIGNQFGYLELPGLVGTPDDQAAYSQQAHDAFAELETSSPRCGWVFDLRRNRGGYYFPMLAGVGPFLAPPEGGTFAGKVDGNERFERWTYEGGAIRLVRPGGTQPTEPLSQVARPFVPRNWDAPVAVLTSALTASAGEAVTVSFRNRPNSRSFGEPTAGLTTSNVLRSMPDGAFLIVTNAAFADRAGATYDGPVTPDQTVGIDWTHVGDGEDPTLIAATTWLATQPACR